MPPEPLHLVERAALRLRQSGMLEDSSAQLLTPAAPAAADPPPPPAEPGPAPIAEAPLEPTPIVTNEVLERAGMIDWTSDRSRISEEFRVIQSQLLRAAFAPENTVDGYPNLVMITSSRPGEGKSFAALNIAASIARQRDRDVLLVDVDPKRDALGQTLGLGKAAGLLNLASNPRLDPESLLVRTSLEKLSILPLGNDKERDAELFSTRQMARLIRDLGRRYADRLVIIDAPPCLSSSEPSALAPIVGQIVVVVEAERTQRPEVEAAIDLIQACPTIMLLLNKIQLTTKHSFGAYASRYYPA